MKASLLTRVVAVASILTGSAVAAACFLPGFGVYMGAYVGADPDQVGYDFEHTYSIVELSTEWTIALCGLALLLVVFGALLGLAKLRDAVAIPAIAAIATVIVAISGMAALTHAQRETTGVRGCQKDCGGQIVGLGVDRVEREVKRSDAAKDPEFGRLEGYNAWPMIGWRLLGWPATLLVWLCAFGVGRRWTWAPKVGVGAGILELVTWMNSDYCGDENVTVDPDLGQRMLTLGLVGVIAIGVAACTRGNTRWGLGATAAGAVLFVAWLGIAIGCAGS